MKPPDDQEQAPPAPGELWLAGGPDAPRRHEARGPDAPARIERPPPGPDAPPQPPPRNDLSAAAATPAEAPREAATPDEPREAAPPEERREAAAPAEPREAAPPVERREAAAPDEPRETAPSHEPRQDAPPGDEPRQAPTGEAKPPPREPLGERIGRVDPQAGELSELLREHLALPGIVAAAIAAAVSAAIVLAAGLVIAVITPDASILGVVGHDASILTEGFRHAVGTLLTAMVDPGLLISGSRRIHPLLLLAIPLTSLILTTRWQLHRTAGAPALARLAWATAVGVPFGLLMLAFAVIGGETESTSISPAPGSAFALGLLWGIVGGLIGAATRLPLDELTASVPKTVKTVLVATVATLRPLAAVLVTCTAIGLVGWLVQVGADAGGVRSDRSAATALIEEAAFAGEHGVHLTALAAGARFTADANGPLGLPFPVAEANDVPGRGGVFRSFSYGDAMPAYVLLPALALLMALVVLGALYAGFAAARAVEARTLGTGAAWGAITGPSWAVAMAILVVLAGGLFHGDADDASVFGVFLIGGALLGAAGGALAVSGQPAPRSD